MRRALWAGSSAGSTTRARFSRVERDLVVSAQGSARRQRGADAQRPALPAGSRERVAKRATERRSVYATSEAIDTPSAPGERVSRTHRVAPASVVGRKVPAAICPRGAREEGSNRPGRGMSERERALALVNHRVSEPPKPRGAVWSARASVEPRRVRRRMQQGVPAADRRRQLGRWDGTSVRQGAFVHPPPVPGRHAVQPGRRSTSRSDPTVRWAERTTPLAPVGHGRRRRRDQTWASDQVIRRSTAHRVDRAARVGHVIQTIFGLSPDHKREQLAGGLRASLGARERLRVSIDRSGQVYGRVGARTRSWAPPRLAETGRRSERASGGEAQAPRRSPAHWEHLQLVWKRRYRRAEPREPGDSEPGVAPAAASERVSSSLRASAAGSRREAGALAGLAPQGLRDVPRPETGRAEHSPPPQRLVRPPSNRQLANWLADIESAWAEPEVSSASGGSGRPQGWL